jgi:hypothetical protein
MRDRRPIAERLAELKLHQRMDFSRWTAHQECRFCHRTIRELGALWKYSVRHYICDDCRNEKLGRCTHGRIPALSNQYGPEKTPCTARPGGHHAFVYSGVSIGACECGEIDPFCWIDTCNEGLPERSQS